MVAKKKNKISIPELEITCKKIRTFYEKVIQNTNEDGSEIVVEVIDSKIEKNSIAIGKLMVTSDHFIVRAPEKNKISIKFIFNFEQN